MADFRAAEELRGKVGELLGARDQRADAPPDPERGAGGAAGIERPRTEADDTAGDQEVSGRRRRGRSDSRNLNAIIL